MTTTAYTNEYDRLFRIYTDVYFAGRVDWAWLKAQSIAESSLRPDVVSHAGACGLMQLMPGTSADCSRALRIDDLPFDPRTNIMMGIYYMRKMWDVWKKEEGLERLRFAQASYNAGLGNIVKAQRLAKIPDQWRSLAAALPLVTGRNAKETTNYVQRIAIIHRGL